MYNKKQNQKPLFAEVKLTDDEVRQQATNNDSKQRDQRIMKKEELVNDFEEKQTVAMAKLDAYRNVIESVKRMHESSERKVKEANVAMAKSGDSSNVNPKLKQKALQAQAARDVYYEVLMEVAKAAKECKDAMMRDVYEFNEVFDAMQEAGD